MRHKQYGKPTPVVTETENTFQFPIYTHYVVKIIVTDNVAQTHDRICEKYKLRHDARTAQAFCASFSSGGTIMVLPCDASLPTIAHESAHVARALFNHIGAKEVDDEIFAYTLEFITNHALKTQYSWRDKWTFQRSTTRLES